MTDITRRLMLLVSASWVALSLQDHPLEAPSIKMPYQIVIVYAAQSKLVQRIIHLDIGEPIENHLDEGHDYLTLDGVVTSLPEATKAVADKHGIDVADMPSGRCALVDQETGLVQSQFIMACAILDKHSKFKLIASDTAKENWKYDGEKFLPRYVLVDNNIVTDIIWTDKKPINSIEHSTAMIGDEIKLPSIICVASAGTRKI